MSTTLKPCPFCGGEAAIRDDSHSGGGFCVVCVSPDCFATLGEGYDRDAMPDHSFPNEDAAIAAWSRRAPEAGDDAREDANVQRLIHEAYWHGFHSRVGTGGRHVPADRLRDAKKHAKAAKHFAAKVVTEIRRLRQYIQDQAQQCADHDGEMMGEIRRLRMKGEPGEHIEGFTRRGELAWFLEQKGKAYSTSMEVWTYPQRTDDEPTDVTVILRAPAPGGESEEP